MSGPKRISGRTIIGQQGINLIEKRVLELGWIWNATTLDAGIDGVIEIRDPKTEEATNLILQVQSKATSDTWTREADGSFEFLSDERDIDYWMRGNAPVLLVCSRPRTDEAYWIAVKVGLRALAGDEPIDLYEVIRRRYERASIIITSNRALTEWAPLFRDELLAAAAMDRLLHHAHVVEITGGSSYRNPPRGNGAKARAA